MAVANGAALQDRIEEKARQRCLDESRRPLALYRKQELVQMHKNFYGSDEFQQARRRFVFKVSNTGTLEDIAHRRRRRFGFSTFFGPRAKEKPAA